MPHRPQRYVLHRLLKQADFQNFDRLLARNARTVNERDHRGYTPLMYAVTSGRCGVPILGELLRHGADIHAEASGYANAGSSVLQLALGAGDPVKIAALIGAGADIKYRTEHGYDALLDAVHGRDVLHDARLLDLLRLLIAQGVSLSSVSTYRESALRVLSRIGRFDAVGLLLEAGADADHLQWTPLMRAVALGSTENVDAVLNSGPQLEAKDWWERTAWLLAVQTGSIAKAQAIRAAGADVSARGRCAKPAMFYAIEAAQPAMLECLIESGFDIEDTDAFGATPLITAAECGGAQCVEILLRAGARVDREHNGATALGSTSLRPIIERLLRAGADPRYLSCEARRVLAGLPRDPDLYLLEVSRPEFLRARTRRFGAANPEQMREPFWEGMARAGISGYEATQWLDGPCSIDAAPVWCAQRFGQSITILPDGRVVQIGGEHEDHYDPDFCIYNDVFLHETTGALRIFGYPEATFAPTDFHSATLVGQHIYVIGSLGYAGTREPGRTPVYRLDTRDFRIERVHTEGAAPGWIYSHRADYLEPHSIRVGGGKLVTVCGDEEMHLQNEASFELDLKRLVWRRL